MTGRRAVRVPASSANLGAGFDVLAMALDLYLDAGIGAPPAGAAAVDTHHPTAKAYSALGGSGDALWIRSSIPMGRGLGFSGAARVAGAALAVAERAEDFTTALAAAESEILASTAALEGHGDNVAASLRGGVVAWVGDRALPLRIGANLAAASVVAWLPDSSTSTERSRLSLAPKLDRDSVVVNLGRVAQFVVAVEQDETELLRGATDDRIHQSVRLAEIPGAAAALGVGVEAGAWCGWLSGSGPTVAWLCHDTVVERVVGALPTTGHTKMMRISRRGAHLIDS